MKDAKKKEVTKSGMPSQKGIPRTHHINVFAFSYDNEPRNIVVRWKIRGNLKTDGPMRNAQRLRSIHKALKTRHLL